MADIDQAVPDVPMDPAGGEVEYFHTYDDGEGNVTNFKDGNEVNDYFKQHVWKERDYTQKSQARESEYKKKVSDFEADSKRRTDEFNTMKSKYDNWDNVLKTRPSVARQLERLANKPPGANEISERSQGYVDEKFAELAQRLDARDEQDRSTELEQQREGIYTELTEQYPDFDREAVTQAVAALDGNNLKGLVEMIHKSSKYDPVGMQQSIEEDMQAKQGARMLRSGGAPTSRKAASPKTTKEAKAAALRDIGIV